MIHKMVDPDYYTMCGNSVRRSLQYEGNTPRIDILIRESIQNSFDVLRDNSEMLDLSFNHGIFDTDALSIHLIDLEEKLPAIYGAISEFIEIRDVNTVGLDGPFEAKKKKDYGNLIKLVYEIGEKQIGEGKGGSWGYGKTNYYSFGNGLVIFYSRTKVDDRYENRLIVSLIEDTDHRENMLFPESDLGISFWGAQGIDDVNHAIPITDDGEIAEILNIFNSKLFNNDETGTSIIIPFIDRKTLVKESVSKIFDTVDPEVDPDDFQYYVELAVQRWYFPRLLNRERGKYLRFSFNGVQLSDDRIQPLFHCMREIYNETFMDNCSEVEVKSGALPNGCQPVARYSSRSINITDLGSDKGMSVYNMLELKHDPSRPNSPIGFRCRSLGMVNTYDVDEGIVRGAKQSNPDEYFIVGMRLIPDVIIVDKNNPNFTVTNLEQYIRKGENPAHTVWNDVNLHEIDYRVQNFTPHIKQDMVKALANVFAVKTDRESIVAQRNLGLSRKMGKMFLPNEGYGKGSTPRSGGGHGGGSSGNSSKVKLSILSKKVVGSEVYLEMSMELKDGQTAHTLILSPSVDNDDVGSVGSIEEWESKCGIPFPVSISSFSIIEINGTKTTNVASIESGTFNINTLCVEAVMNGERMHAIKISHPLDVEFITVRLKFNDASCAFKLNMSLVGGDSY